MSSKRLPWTTRADNYKTWEDFAAREELISKREEMRGHEEEAAVHDYAAQRAKNEAHHIELEREGTRAALASTHIPGAEIVETIIYYGAPVNPADTQAVVEEGRKIFNEDLDSDGEDLDSDGEDLDSDGEDLDSDS